MTDWVRQAVADREGDAGHAGQAGLVARGGHAAWPLPPGHAVQAGGRPRRAGQRHGAAHADLGPIDPRRRLSAEHARTGATRWCSRASTAAAPEASIGYAMPNLLIDHAMRNPHGAARLLARRQPEPQHDLPRMLHRRDRARDRQDPLALRRKLMAKPPEAPRRCSMRWPSASAGTSRRQRAVYRGLAQTMGFGSYVAACAEVSVSDDGRAEDPPHRRCHRPGPRGQPAADRGPGRRLVRLRPVGGAVRRVHAEGRPHRADQFRHAIRCCAWTRCRRSRRS